MRRAAVAATTVVVAFALAATLAPAAPERDALVRPGRGIGRVSLGMTLAQVRRTLGPHTAVNARKRLGFGETYVELDWTYSTWRVGFEGRRGRLRAVRVATTMRRQRTPEGLGPDSRIRDIVRVYPRATCSDWAGLGTNSSVGRWVTVRHAGGARTVFVVLTEGTPQPPPGRVVEVMVQRPARGLAETRRPCRGDWRRQ